MSAIRSGGLDVGMLPIACELALECAAMEALIEGGANCSLYRLSSVLGCSVRAAACQWPGRIWGLSCAAKYADCVCMLLIGALAVALLCPSRSRLKE